jgi:cell division protease FtsH
MGGRLAEEIVFGQKTTGAGNDIERATELARRMVCEWGMSEAMGPLAFGKKEGEVFLGREMGSVQTYSEKTAQEIDTEVHRIVVEQYERAKKVLTEGREILSRVADALIEYETLDAADIDVLMSGGAISRPPPVKPLPTTQVDRSKPGVLVPAKA